VSKRLEKFLADNANLSSKKSQQTLQTKRNKKLIKKNVLFWAKYQNWTQVPSFVAAVSPRQLLRCAAEIRTSLPIRFILALKKVWRCWFSLFFFSLE
jgi:hypothetical protein